MALSTYSLLSITEARDACGQSATKNDSAVQDCANEASAALEKACSRNFVTRGLLTEYHTITKPQSRLKTLCWPIISASSSDEGIWEDSSRGYTSTYKLTIDTDLIVSKPDGELIRVVDGGGARSWAPGFRAIKVKYRGGYANTAAIPSDLKRIARELCGIMWRPRDKGEWGVASRTSASGTVSRYLPPVVTESMLRQLLLGGWRRLGFGGRTGEQDA